MSFSIRLKKHTEVRKNIDNNMIYKIELTDISRKFHPKTSEYKLYSTAFELFIY